MTRITRLAMAKLKAECERRYLSEAAYVPFGKVVSELLERHLPDVDGIAPAAEKLPSPSETRGRNRPSRVA